MSLILEIDNKLYDVHNFVEAHPGEGIRNMYLSHYKNKKVSNEFEQFHTTNESMQLLLDAQTNGAANGIIFLGENPFSHKRRIFRQFRYFAVDDDSAADVDVVVALNALATQFLHGADAARFKGLVAYCVAGKSGEQILVSVQSAPADDSADPDAASSIVHYQCEKSCESGLWLVADFAERFDASEKLEDLLSAIADEHTSQ